MTGKQKRRQHGPSVARVLFIQKHLPSLRSGPSLPLARARSPKAVIQTGRFDSCQIYAAAARNLILPLARLSFYHWQTAHSPQPFFDHLGGWAPQGHGRTRERDGGRRATYAPICRLLGMRPATHLFLPLFLRLCSEDSHTRPLRTSSIFHLFLSVPDVSRLLLPSQASVGGGGRQTDCVVRLMVLPFTHLP